MDRHDVTAEVGAALAAAVAQPCGILLVAGPTGQGKTALAVELLNARQALGLDGIFHGDLRTGTAARAALLDARTRFVVGVLRGGESSRVFGRLYDLLDGPLPSIDLTVATMRLLPRLCPHCRRAASFRNGPMRTSFWRGDGCEDCEEGFFGKVRVVEVLRYDAGASAPKASSGDLATDGQRRLEAGLVSTDELERYLPSVERARPAPELHARAR